MPHLEKHTLISDIIFETLKHPPQSIKKKKETAGWIASLNNYNHKFLLGVYKDAKTTADYKDKKQEKKIEEAMLNSNDLRNITTTIRSVFEPTDISVGSSCYSDSDTDNSTIPDDEPHYDPEPYQLDHE